ncbi:MAG: nitroreductase/quinone reductase family protein [Dehalococcoidia bacterium]|nr:nitroreductase/quinone reductase family protein [Dehalococcoidia bacterium]
MADRDTAHEEASWVDRAAEAVYGRVFGLVSWLGLPPWFIVTLETKGRRSGRVHSNVLILTQWGGQRYAVSVLGDGSDWVRNIRAARHEAVIRHGRRQRVRLEEVPAEERAPVLKAYLKWALGARHIIGVPLNAPIEEFERIAPDFPVFRIVKV